MPKTCSSSETSSTGIQTIQSIGSVELRDETAITNPMKQFTTETDKTVKLSREPQMRDQPSLSQQTSIQPSLQQKLEMLRARRQQQQGK